MQKAPRIDFSTIYNAFLNCAGSLLSKELKENEDVEGELLATPREQLQVLSMEEAIVANFMDNITAGIHTFQAEANYLLEHKFARDTSSKAFIAKMQEKIRKEHEDLKQRHTD